MLMESAKFHCENIEKRVSLLEQKFEEKLERFVFDKAAVELAKEALIAESEMWRHKYLTENTRRRVLMWKIACVNCRKDSDIRMDCPICFKYHSSCRWKIINKICT